MGAMVIASKNFNFSLSFAGTDGFRLYEIYGVSHHSHNSRGEPLSGFNFHHPACDPLRSETEVNTKEAVLII
jgi:hypothetical protein